MMERFIVIYKRDNGQRVDLHRIKLEPGMVAEVQTTHELEDGHEAMG